MELLITDDGVLTKYCGKEKRVTVPEGVRRIGREAFAGSCLVECVILPEGVTEISDCAFLGCRSLREIRIPDSVEQIGEGAFTDCEALEAVSVPDRVKEIRPRVFRNCASLTQVKLPRVITTIGNESFATCVSLKEISIPEGVYEIGKSAFFGCSGLSGIVIPEGLKRIGEHAFSLCTYMKDAVIPHSLEKIGEFAFGGYSSQGRIHIDFRLIGELEKSYANAVWAAVRGFISRKKNGLTTPEEDALWRGYVARRTVKAFEYMLNEPQFYRYVTENRIISPNRVPALLSITENAECRAILLDYGNGRGNKRNVEKTVDTLFSLDD